MNKPFNTVHAAGNLICDHAHLVRAYLAAAECFGRGTPERDALERVAGTIRLALSYAAHIMGAEETAARALNAKKEG